MATEAVTGTAAEDPIPVDDEVQISSWYSYLKYSPTMHWNFGSIPDADTYWVGIFKVGAKDSEYLHYKYIKRIAQGSHTIGELKSRQGMNSTDGSRTEEFELRIFNEWQRVSAKTNSLYGAITVMPINPYVSDPANVVTEQLDTDMSKFMQQISIEGLLSSSLEDSSDTVTAIQLPSGQIGEKEPSIRFHTAKPGSGVIDKGDIALHLTLDSCKTEVFPVVTVGTQRQKTFMGIFRPPPDRGMKFNPASCINNKWVKIDKVKTERMPFIKEKADGPISMHYFGVLFSSDSKTVHQCGLAATYIEAVISTGPAPIQPTFDPKFNKERALRYAKLSQLAYKPYDTVRKQLPTFNLNPVMEIYYQRDNTHGFIANDEDSIVVAFRGTEIISPKNLLTDIRICQTRILAAHSAYAHRGFVSALNAVYGPIENVISKNLEKGKQLFITGHSLGGALASLLGYRISIQHSTSKHTYGCPPIGNEDLRDHFNGMDSNVIIIRNDVFGTGKIMPFKRWNHCYHPITVKYLPDTGGHPIKEYIKQLEKL